MYFSVIYVSKAVKRMEDDDLLPLLEQSRDWNKTHGITGMLLYLKGKVLDDTEGRFMQVLEGSEFEINRLFTNIKVDKRHQNITVLNETAITKRSFKDWTMGFESLDVEECKATPGFFELNEAFFNNSKTRKFNIALNFLKSFYNLHTTNK